MPTLQTPPSQTGINPCLMVNLYAAGRLDLLLDQVVEPWRRGLKQGSLPDLNLWWLRCGTGGEHLKLRVHTENASPSALEAAQQDLEARFQAFFAQNEPIAERPTQGRPLEPADRDEHPDGSLLWLRSAADQAEDSDSAAADSASAPLADSFGSAPLVDDEQWRARLSRALSAGCDLFLQGRLPEDAQSLPFVLRVRGWSLLLQNALDVVCRDEQERQDYLRYHRDTLIRSQVLGRTKSRPKAASFLDRWHRESEGPRAPALEIPTSWADERADAVAAWRQAAQDADQHLRGQDESSALQIDPFVDSLRLPGLFKLLHGMANAFGLNINSEGWILHHRLHSGSNTDSEALDSMVTAPGLEPIRRSEASMLADDEPRFNIDVDYLWLKLIGAGSPEGADFVERYRRSMKPIAEHLRQALGCLRGRKVPEGKEHVDAAHGLWQELKDQPDVYHLVGRFFYGSRSYYDFVTGDLPTAIQALDQAGVEIGEALSRFPYLLPFAPICTDVPLKKARLARDRGQWDEMKVHLDTVRAFASDREPLLQLHDGTEVRHATLVESLAHLPDDDPELGSSLAYLRQPEIRQREADYVVESLYRLSGQILPLPPKIKGKK